MGERRKRVAFVFYVDAAEVKRIERVEAALKARHPGLRVTRSDAARVVVNVGLGKLERELGLDALPSDDGAAGAKPAGARRKRRGARNVNAAARP